MGNQSIIVAGGGVGGLCTALALAKIGRTVRVLEQAPQFGAIGYGIQLGPNVFPMFERLGVREAVLAHSIRPENVWMFDATNGEAVTRVHTGAAFIERFGHPYIVIHRIDLHNVLAAACRSQPNIHMDENAQVTGYVDHGDHVAVSLADGRSVSGDLLIGCDGIRSVVRAGIMGDGDPVPIGYVAHRAIVPIENAPKGVPLGDVALWGGEGFHIVHYPLRDASVFNIVAVFRSDTYDKKLDTESYRAELQRTYAGAHPAMRDMIAMMDLERRWTIADRTPRRGWWKGRVALLGDAAHATLQSMAQGACMAIEDAVVLSALLDMAGDRHEAAFARYERERLLRTARVQLESRYMWNIFYHTGGVEAQLRNSLYQPRSDADVYDCLNWLYTPITPPKTLDS